MRILTLSNAPLREDFGSGKSVLQFTHALRRCGNEVRLFGPESFEVWRGSTRAVKVRQALGALRLLRRTLPVFAADIIEFYGDEFWLAAEWVKRLSQRPLLIAHSNGLELLDWERRSSYDPRSMAGLRGGINRTFHIPLSRRFFKSVDRLVTLSSADCEYACRSGLQPQDHCAVIEPGLDEEVWRPSSPLRREARIGFIGSWIPRKGISHFVSVVSRVFRANSEVTCEIFGAGCSPDIVLSNFRDEDRSRVTVHPPLEGPQLYAMLARCRVFFFPSQYEGFGIALAEAMACGVAVVTTPTGFGSDLVDQKDALLVPFEAETGESYSAIMKLLEDDAYCQSMAKQGQERVRTLSWPESGRRLNTLYCKWHEEFSGNATSIRRSTS